MASANPCRPTGRICCDQFCRHNPGKGRQQPAFAELPLVSTFPFGPFDPWLAYGQSKTANVLMAVEATRRWASAGIFANALNPGAIPTNLQKHVGGKLVTPPEKQKTTQQGAATSVLLATSRQLEGIGGRYFEDCNEAGVVDRRPDNFGGGVAPYALDPENAERLWSLATTMLAP
jgi:NAD(P)-dependent dehydrogenase (short-subunit alcohol dehydrogenase family)